METVQDCTLADGGQEFIDKIIKSVFGTYSLPLFNGLIGLLMLSCVACIIVMIFNIRDEVLAGLIGALCVTFPSVISTYFFMYLVPMFSFAILLSVGSAYILVKQEKPNRKSVLAIFMLVLSMGIYQTYFVNAVTTHDILG